jgi:hypothetical protein
MLPFTTYHIPEATKNQTPLSGKWLFFLHNENLTAEKTDLLGKIATALKADSNSQVTTLQVTEPISFHDFIPAGNSLVISFGVPLPSLGLHIDLQHEGLRLMEKHAVILSHSLDALENQAALKKSLWRDMQLYLSTLTASNA